MLQRTNRKPVSKAVIVVFGFQPGSALTAELFQPRQLKSMQMRTARGVCTYSYVQVSVV